MLAPHVRQIVTERGVPLLQMLWQCNTELLNIAWPHVRICWPNRNRTWCSLTADVMAVHYRAAEYRLATLSRLLL